MEKIEEVFTPFNQFCLCVFLAGMTGTKQNLKSSSQSWQKMYPKMVCVSTSWKKRYKHTLKCSLEEQRLCVFSVFGCVCVEQRWVSSRVFPQGGPLDGSHTHIHSDTHTHSPHGPNYASSGALLTLLPKYRSKNNLPSPASPTS